MRAEDKIAMRPFWTVLLLVIVAGAFVASGQVAPGNGISAEQDAALRAAMDWVRTTPAVHGNYDYVMTARIRLLFFWVTRNDVGGGTIRRGAVPDDPNREFISLLIGSDPAKAKKINRWGAAMEVVEHAADEAKSPQTSVFFGFMTRAKADESTEEAKSQIEKEKSKKEFQYQAVISRLDRQQGIAKTVPFATEKELDIYQFAPMKEKVFSELGGGGGKYRETPAALRQRCARVSGFLASVAELVDGALQRGATKGEACYIHYGELYTLKLLSVKPVAEKSVRVELKSEPKLLEHTYQNLLQTEFQILNHQTGKKTDFELLMATQGRLRGVPVQITYQPNWWIEIVLNLKPEQSTH